MFEKFLCNVPEYSGVCLKRLWGMFEKTPRMLSKISGNVIKESGECSRRSWGM